MKVETKSNTTLFGELEKGACFLDVEEKHCMKISKLVNIEYNAVNLETGNLICYKDEALVEELNATIQIRR